MRVDPKMWPELERSTRSHRSAASQSLFLKFRLVILRRMTRREATEKLKRAVRTGVVPEGIEIHWVDWKSGREGHFNEGSVDAAELAQLRVFYGALNAAETRIEKVRPST